MSDEIATEGGCEPGDGGVPCPECTHPKPKYGACPKCGYKPYAIEGRQHVPRANTWRRRSAQNLDRWGEQPPVDLVLAIAEEVGELADEVLEAGRFETHEAFQAQVVLRAVRDAGWAARSFLESFFEDEGEPIPTDERPDLGSLHDIDAVQDELDDLAPLLYQLAWALEEARDE